MEDYQKKFVHMVNYKPSKGGQLGDKIPNSLKLEIIKESATPQPYEWELGDYDVLGGSFCGIENNIFYDEGQSYKHNNHPLWVYVEFRNIKNKNPGAYYNCFYLPITVEKHPQIIGNIDGMGINPKKISNLKRFISGNVKWFQDVADKKIRSTKNNKPIPIFLLKEDRCLLTEMPNFSKTEINLPVNIWIDPGSNPQHSVDRIKFQNDYSDDFHENNLCTLLLFGDMKVIGNTILSNDEVDVIRNFCKLNKRYIDLIHTNQINRDGFIEQTTKVDKKGKIIQKSISPNSTWEIKHGMTRFNISVVVSNSNQFNYLKNNQLLCNCWFDEANSFQECGTAKVAFARSGNIWYKIDENGGIEEYMNENDM
jgi:hypothetical protein